MGLIRAAAITLYAWPYAVWRCASLLGYSVGLLVWLALTIAGAIGLAARTAPAVASALCVVSLLALGALWRFFLRPRWHWVEAGHIAVLTELLTRGSVNNSQHLTLFYGTRAVQERFHETSLLMALQHLVRGVLQQFHRTMDWGGDILAVPRVSLKIWPRNLIFWATRRYLDKAILSYDFARNDPNPWRSNRDGLIYYCQNAKPILQTATSMIFLDAVFSLALFLCLLSPTAFALRWFATPFPTFDPVLDLFVAAILTAPLRTAFVQPVLLVMLLVRFHAVIEGQVINPAWNERLGQISKDFHELWNSPIAFHANKNNRPKPKLF